MTALQIFLLAYLILFYGIAFFWRSYQTWRQTGVNPYRLNQGDGLYRYVGGWYRLISIAVVVAVLIYSLAPGWYRFFTPIDWLAMWPATAVGIGLLLASLLWVLLAQAHMGASWRVGIDADHDTALVTEGVFGCSRNPIFLGMRGNLLGLFLVIPNAVTLTIWLLGDVLLQIQVYMEEAYLAQKHEAAYEAYRQQVPRWL